MLLRADYKPRWVDGKRVGRWYIYVVTTDGKRAALGGWEHALFKSYSKCVQAIQFIREHGGSYQSWRASQR